MKVYLAGRMGKRKIHQEWRQDMAEFLKTLGIKALDPYLLEPLQLRGLKPNRLPKGMNHWYDLKDSDNPRNIQRFLRYMQAIIRYDIKIVTTKADVVIVYWDRDCATGAGTHAEMTFALLKDKPVYCVLEKGVKLPAWAHGCCTEVFGSFSALKDFILECYDRRKS